ncbi:MAG: prepilin-type N-terminal cleavage/methylation domain-containing protein [Gemmatimonadaceae bacterium]|nr:prepilin-type N-terminal cleavage/methylation domain-containing protein [Gemmatimonadaceae bacterium]
MKKSVKRKQGFVLLEVIVAMFILSIVLSSLAALMFRVSRGSFLSVGGAYRNGILLQEVNRLEALPYDSLAVGTATASVSALPYPHSRQVIVTNPATNVKAVKLIITPTNALYKPDTASFTRTLGATTTAFNTTQ